MKHIGYVIGEATTSKALVHLTSEGQQIAREGMLVEIRAWRGAYRALARISRLRAGSSIVKSTEIVSVISSIGADVAEVADATRYIVAETEILGLAGRPGLPPLPKPPLPGDHVYSLPNDAERIYGVKPGAPGVIWYGSLYGYDDLPVPLNVENITMHVGVFGETGSGKSYGVGYLLELLSRIPAEDREYVTLPAIVIDANGDYLDYVEVFAKTGKAVGFDRVYRFVSPKLFDEKLKFTLEASKGVTKPLRITLRYFTIREVAEMLIAYKTGGRELNELQVAALERALNELTQEGFDIDELLSKKHELVMEKLEELGRSRETGINIQTARAAKSAVEKFYRDVVEMHGLIGDATFDEKLVDEISGRRPSLVIIDFSADGFPGASISVKQLIVSYIARLLYSVFTRYKMLGDERYVLFVIEEAQNYAPNTRNYPIGVSVARDYLALIATQGRKFGICLLVVSQRPAFLDPVVLSMLNTLFIHRISPDDVSYVLRAAGGLPQEMASLLTRLPRGTAVIVGQMNMIGQPVLVRVGKRSVAHRVGGTAVVKTLRSIQRVSKS